MHIHILGICGTFMGGLAILARQLGYRVSGSDANVYPPMSTQLQEQGIELKEGYSIDHFTPRPDLVVIGNALSRGNPAVEFTLAEGLTYTSGPQWLAQYVLHDRWVLGVAGTHGKTTTTSMLAWIMECAGLKPGFLIGGVARNFEVSARAGETPFFIVEADEYDTAFFDKRPKFIHYAPRTTILNNLEYDHADIFPDLDAIELQFHYLVRTIPGNGLIISPHDEAPIDMVLRRGCWTPRQQFGIDVPEEICKKLAANGGVFWNAVLGDKYGSRFDLEKYGQGVDGSIMNRVRIEWNEIGLHNVRNAMSAVAAAHHAGVDVISAGEALNTFKGVKRRLELLGEGNGVRVYDDFAHHPTAIESTLNGLKEKLNARQEEGRIIAVIEPRSNTMKMGVHQDELVVATQPADIVIWKMPQKCGLNFNSMISASETPAYSFKDVDEIIQFIEVNAQPGDHVVIMSNGGFENIHQRLLRVLNPAAH